MKNYIYGNSWTQELEDLIEVDKAKPLIMEMFYKHGLRAYEVITTNGEMVGCFKHKYMLTLDGLPYCQVYVEELRDNKVQYCFFSPYFEKARGRDLSDKRTIRASKISGLMRMLDKYKCVVDDPIKIIGQNTLGQALSSAFAELMKGSKGYRRSFLPSEQFDVLQAYMTGTKLPIHEHEDIKNMFDMWCKEVETERHALEKVQTLYGSNEFYVLAETEANGICIGKAKFTFKAPDSIRDNTLEITDSFQRVASIHDLEGIDDLKSFMVMYKIYTESREDMKYRISRKPKDKLIVPDSGYIKDMECYASSVNYSVSNFSMNVLIVCIEGADNETISSAIAPN